MVRRGGKRRAPGTVSHNQVNRNEPESRSRIRLLDLSRENTFRYAIQDWLAESGTKPEQIGTFVASVYSKASKIGIREAQDFVAQKAKEGVITPEVAKRIRDHIERHAMYR